MDIAVGLDNVGYWIDREFVVVKTRMFWGLTLMLTLQPIRTPCPVEVGHVTICWKFSMAQKLRTLVVFEEMHCLLYLFSLTRGFVIDLTCDSWQIPLKQVGYNSGYFRGFWLQTTAWYDFVSLITNASKYGGLAPNADLTWGPHSQLSDSGSLWQEMLSNVLNRALAPTRTRVMQNPFACFAREFIITFTNNSQIRLRNMM